MCDILDDNNDNDDDDYVEGRSTQCVYRLIYGQIFEVNENGPNYHKGLLDNKCLWARIQIKLCC